MPARAALGDLHKIDLVAQVEARGRLVEQQHAGTVIGFAAGQLNKNAREMRALLLAAGERRQFAVPERLQFEFGDGGVDQLLRCGTRAIARAHEHDFLDGERKAHIDMLGQHDAVVREVPRRERGEVAAFEADAAAAAFQIAGQQPQQCRFAGAVRSDNGDGLAAMNPCTDAIEQRRMPDLHADRIGFDQRWARGRHDAISFRCRNRMNRKNGAPSAAVRIPIGTSAGAASTRAMVSASMRRMAPRQTEAGSSIR